MGPRLLVLVFYCLFGLAITSSQVSEPVSSTAGIGPLLILLNSITNWEQYSTANKIVGWNETVPVCDWTFVACDAGGAVTSLDLSCSNCIVRAQGSLPPQLVDIASLEYLDLSFNAFRGTLPPGWGAEGAFPNLNVLLLESTELEGELPIEWGHGLAFRSLERLSLRNNNITGRLPRSWGSSDAFPTLQTLDLSLNSLVSYVPGAWVDLGDETTYIWLKPGNEKMCGLCPVSDKVVMCAARDGQSGDPADCKVLRDLYDSCRQDANQQDLQPATNLLPVFLQLGFAQEPPYSFDQEHAEGLVQALATVLPDSLPDGIFVLSPIVNSTKSVEPRRGLGEAAVAPTWVLRLKQRRMLQEGGGDADGFYTMLVAATITSAPESNAQLLQEDLQRSIEDGQLLEELIYNGWTGLTEVEVVKDPENSSGDSRFGNSSSSNAGASIGIALGVAIPTVAVASAALLAAALLLWRRMRREAREKAGSTGLPTSPCSGGADAEEISMSWRYSPAGSYGVGRRASRSPPGSNGLHRLPGREEEGGAAWDACSLAAMLEHSSFSDWQIDPTHLQLCEHSDGTLWELGRGSFSRVYKAYYNDMHAVAVKVLARASDALVSDFQKEVAVLRRCHNKNIVQFLGACLANDQLLLAFEFMEGGDLFKWLSGESQHKFQWTLPDGRPGLAARVATDVARGLHFLHKRRIVHNDIKSANILLARDGTAKIGDVGLAKFLRHDYVSTTSGVVGTFAWAAPEVLLGRPFCESADMYSYGVLLWELSSKEKPERGLLRRLRVPEECPALVAELIDTCLDENPRARPSAQQVVEALHSLDVSPGLPPRRSNSLASSSAASAHVEAAESSSTVAATEPSSAPGSASGGAGTSQTAQGAGAGVDGAPSMDVAFVDDVEIDGVTDVDSTGGSVDATGGDADGPEKHPLQPLGGQHASAIAA